jgi:hypothetical protein
VALLAGLGSNAPGAAAARGLALASRINGNNFIFSLP